MSGSFTTDSSYLLIETADSVDAYGRVTKLTDARAQVTPYVYNGGTGSGMLARRDPGA